VWSGFVVVYSPELDRRSRISEACEPALVQAFVPRFAVEALDVAILHGLVRLDEVQPHAVVVRPLVERVAREFTPVIADDTLGQSMCVRELRQHPRHTLPESEISTSMTGHSRVKSSTTLSARKARPSPRVSWTKSMLQRSPRAVTTGFTLRATATRLRPPDRESFLAIHALHQLPVHQTAFAAQQQVEPPIAPAWPQEREGLQALP